MEVMYLLIAFSLIIASGFLGAFIWAVRNGQFDDRDTPSIRMLVDDVVPRKKKKTTSRVDGDGADAGSDGPNERADHAAESDSIEEHTAQAAESSDPNRSTALGAKPVHPIEFNAPTEVSDDSNDHPGLDTKPIHPNVSTQKKEGTRQATTRPSSGQHELF